MRIRLVFEEENLLTKKQSGLRRCWFLIKPEIATVADLETELCRRFLLHRNCPHGVIFKMDDFVIPRSESTSFFREKDIISVHKRKCKKKQMITSGDDMQPIGRGEAVKKEAVPCSNEMLAIESRERIESRNNQVNRERNSSVQTQLAEMGSKRKHKEIEKPESSKKKKKKPKPTTIEKPIVNGSIFQETQDIPSQQSLQLTITSEQILHEKANLSVVNEASPMAVVSYDTSQIVPERNKQFEENCNANMSEPNSEVLTKKLPSRSARRKHTKRQLKKLSKSQAAENMQSEALLNGTEKLPTENVVPACEPTVTRDLVVQRVDRPGHIRFESEGEDDENNDEGPSNIQPDEPPVESFHWNGITNKTKGQKWGQESNRYSASRYNSTTVNWRDGTDEDSFANEKVTEKSTSSIGKDITMQVNFEGLSPLTRSPKVGELIAYRVVELSSGWCPDLSPFRVGEVKAYDLMSNNIILAPVPEYPISSDGKEDNANEGEEDAPYQDDLSLYKEDGSLEIEFSSLVDVRLLRVNSSVSLSASPVNRKNSSQAATKTDKYPASRLETAVAKSSAGVKNLFLNNSQNVAVQTGGEESMLVPTGTEPSYNRVANGEAENAVVTRHNNNWDVGVQNDPGELMHDATETEPTSNWEANGEVANAGNTVAQKNGWENWAPNTSTPSWSYRALRSTALGPTLARLRGNDGNATSGYGNAIRGNGRGRGRGGGRGRARDGGRSRGGQRRGRGNYGMSS